MKLTPVFNSGVSGWEGRIKGQPCGWSSSLSKGALILFFILRLLKISMRNKVLYSLILDIYTNV